MTMNVIQVVECIERAFEKVQRDPDQSLHQAQLADQGIGRKISQKEWRAAGLLDLETNWHEVSDADLEECDAALSHMTPLSWRFYIPAYMRLTIKQVKMPIWENNAPHWTLFSLTYSDNYRGMGTFHKERFEQLNEAQCAAVREFLMFVMENSGENDCYVEQAKEALEQYWDRDKMERSNSMFDTDAQGRRST